MMSVAVKKHLEEALNRQRCCVLSDEQKKYLYKNVAAFKRKQHNLQEEQRRNLVNLQGYEKACAEGEISVRRDLLNQLDELIRSLKPTSLDTKQTKLLIWLLDQEDAANTDSDGASVEQEGPALGGPVNRLTKFLGRCCPCCTCCK